MLWLYLFCICKTGVRILTGGICLVLIVTLGIPVFRGTEDFPYKKATNAYFVGQEILDLSSIIHSEGIEQQEYWAMDCFLFTDSMIQMWDLMWVVVYFRRLKKTSEEKFMKKKKIKDWMKKIVAVYYYHDYSLPAEEFQSLVRGSKWIILYPQRRSWMSICRGRLCMCLDRPKTTVSGSSINRSIKTKMYIFWINSWKSRNNSKTLQILKYVLYYKKLLGKACTCSSVDRAVVSGTCAGFDSLQVCCTR